MSIVLNVFVNWKCELIWRNGLRQVLRTNHKGHKKSKWRAGKWAVMCISLWITGSDYQGIQHWTRSEFQTWNYNVGFQTSFLHLNGQISAWAEHEPRPPGFPEEVGSPPEFKCITPTVPIRPQCRTKHVVIRLKNWWILLHFVHLI